MVKFLDTTDVTAHLAQIIKNAKKSLYLISPYLQINPRFRDLIQDRDRSRIDIRIVFGKVDLQPDEINWIKGLDSVKLLFLKNLHAKCYMNEQEAIITSMNLYEFSQQNNTEMGVLVSADEPIYGEIDDEVMRIFRSAEGYKFSVEKVKESGHAPKYNKTSYATKKFKSKKEGFCIRCKASLRLNPLVPFCRDCFNIWKKYSDEEYQEKYCHICGKGNKTSKIKPSCITCYKKNAKVLDFPI